MLTKNLQLTNTTTQDKYTELHKNRVEWEPIKIPKHEILNEKFNSPEFEECFAKIIRLAFELELPVGSFIRAVVEKQDYLPPTAINGLIENIKDEEKHAKVFENLNDVYDINPEIKTKAKQYRQALIHDKTNPLVKARDLETLIFLPVQAILRVYGSEPLERIVANISIDEYRHTNFNWYLSGDVKLGFNTDFEDDLKGIYSWIIESLPNQFFWLNVFNDIRKDGCSDTLNNILNYGVHKAPFEINNAYY